MARLPIIGIASLGALALGGLLGARYITTRKVSAAEQLADALLETETLRDVVRNKPDKSEKLLAACANYMVDVCYRSSEGMGMATGPNDPVGYNRMRTHQYNQVSVSVLTESHAPVQQLTYSVSIPEVGEVRGTRSIGRLKLNGFTPAYPMPDTTQVTLGEDYNAQMETDLHLSETLVTGRPQIFGAITLRDNQGNVGRVNLSNDGHVTGTITREGVIAGRFEGRLGEKVHFKSYQIEA